MGNFDSKINKYLYKFIFETPDVTKFVDPKSGRSVNLNTMVGQPYVFGFFDANCEVTLKSGEKVKLFSDQLQQYDRELVMVQSSLQDRKTHFDCILKLMKEVSFGVQGSKEPVIINIPKVQISLDDNAPQDPTPESVVAINIANPEEYRKARFYNLPQRDVFMISGRFWDNVRDNKGKYSVISFWQFENEVAKHKDLINKLLDEVGVSPSEHDGIYVEFMGQNNPSDPRKTMKEFLSGESEVKEVSVEDKEKALAAKALPHLMTGIKGSNQLKARGFGAEKQAEKAKKAGFGSYAEYSAARNPYGESTETNS